MRPRQHSQASQSSFRAESSCIILCTSRALHDDLQVVIVIFRLGDAPIICCRGALYNRQTWSCRGTDVCFRGLDLEVHGRTQASTMYDPSFTDWQSVSCMRFQ